MKKEKLLTNLYAVFSVVFVLPSIIYLIKNKTVYNFELWFNYYFNNTPKTIQSLSYIAILLSIKFIYIKIIKNRDKLFNDIKSVLKYTALIGIIYIIAIPFTCSDVFYYMGVGRIDSKYKQNPYYITINEYVENNKINEDSLEKDTVLMQGYKNGWSNSTVVYGPIWQIICKGMAFISFGNVDVGLLLFKITNLLVHLINVWIIYKLTGKKVFSIIYGLNPFVLIEGIMCVHNDIFVILFTLLALYFMKKKKLWASIIVLALATAIKYYTILLLPLIIIYYYRKERTYIRILKCIQYGLLFAITLIIPYMLYFQDFSVLEGLITQQTKIAKSIYLVIERCNPKISIRKLKRLLLAIFVIAYLATCMFLLFKENISWREITKKYTNILIVFIFGLITQFQPWYLMWLIPVFMWQKSNGIKIIIATGIIAEFANAIFIQYDEKYTNGVPFAFILYIGIAIYGVLIRYIKTKRMYDIKTLRNRLLAILERW